MRNLELTDKERLILANQYEIMSMLDKHSAEYYLLMSETLRAGHKWLYDQYFDVISENLSDDDAQYVLKILGIYSDLRDSYNQLEDKSDVDEKELSFPGFDGNNESEYLSFAGNLIKHRRFETTLGKTAKNSHMPTTSIYKRMINCWEELGSPLYPYSKEKIQKILAARLHPDYGE
jgi:hypothetical protein